VTDVLGLVLGVDIADVGGGVGMRMICPGLLAMSEDSITGILVRLRAC